MFQQESQIFTVGVEYPEIRLCVFSGNKLTYSISREIPGMILNDKSGILSGKPYKTSSNQYYSIKTKNQYSSNEILCNIIIRVEKGIKENQKGNLNMYFIFTFVLH